MNDRPRNRFATLAMLVGPLALASCQVEQESSSKLSGEVVEPVAQNSFPAVPVEPSAVASSPEPAAGTGLPENQEPKPAGMSPVLVKSHAVAIAEWRKAENRRRCAPLGFGSVGEATGTPRRATFSGGWAVAFDQTARRSAFGVAGPGLIGLDQAGADDQRDRLQRQWPYYCDLPGLPRPSFAGYGIEGAEPYSDANPSGVGQNSLAYVRIGGQTCTYNVWSRLGRRHLELLLDNLVLIEPK